MNALSKCTGKRGFTLVEILIVLAVIGLISAVAFPQFIKARTTAGASICISNLKKLEEGKDLWAVWEGGAMNETPTWSDLIPDYLRKTPSCPLGGSYSLNRMDTDPSCTVDGHALHAEE
ncbi:MAG: prepilin-type N-terminal cleavage/methylation domain-containing protein [Candidatus Omnitrophota bacterium]